MRNCSYGHIFSSWIQVPSDMGKIAEYFLNDLWRVMRPLAYHGSEKAGPFFEGWYFKLISPDGTHRISVIPGIYIGAEAGDSHAFVQVIDGVQGVSHYLPFSAGDFRFIPGEMVSTLLEIIFLKMGSTWTFTPMDSIWLANSHSVI